MPYTITLIHLNINFKGLINQEFYCNKEFSVFACTDNYLAFLFTSISVFTGGKLLHDMSTLFKHLQGIVIKHMDCTFADQPEFAA